MKLAPMSSLENKKGKARDRGEIQRKMYEISEKYVCVPWSFSCSLQRSFDREKCSKAKNAY